MLHPPFETMTLVFGAVTLCLLSLGHHTGGRGYDDRVLGKLVLIWMALVSDDAQTTFEV